MQEVHEQEIFRTVASVIAEALRVNPSRVVPEARIFRDLGAESLDLLDIRFRVEQAFGIKISQDEITGSLGEGVTAEEIKEMLTVGSLVAFVRARVGLSPTRKLV
jgi:acyl carrier protein